MVNVYRSLPERCGRLGHLIGVGRCGKNAPLGRGGFEFLRVFCGVLDAWVVDPRTRKATKRAHKEDGSNKIFGDPVGGASDTSAKPERAAMNAIIKKCNSPTQHGSFLAFDRAFAPRG